jgi:Fe-S oxidoreductase
MLSEMLARSTSDWTPPQLQGRKIVVHGHCHQKAFMTMNDKMKLLRSTGAEVSLLDSGCCGMAGPFGFEKDTFEVSQTLAERILLPAVRAAAESAILVTNGSVVVSN